MIIFEKMVDFDIFCRDPKECFSPLRIFLHDWRNFETCDRRYMKEKFKVQQDNLALCRRKHGVAHEEESDKELENFSGHFFMRTDCIRKT